MSNAIRKLAIGIAIVTLPQLLSGCAQSNSTVYVSPISVTPVTRWIRLLRTNQDLQDFDDFLDSVASGNPRYDSRYRKPGVHGDTTTIECNNVQRIGIAFYADLSRISKIARRSKTVLRIRWRHSSVDTSGRKYDYYATQLSPFILAAESNLLYSAGLQLSHDHEFVNGVYTVIVSYHGTEIYRDFFELEGCDKPYAPEWFEQ